MKELHKVTSMWKQSLATFLYPGIPELLKWCFRYEAPALADVAFEALLGVVIEHVGYAAREVFLAMFNFKERMVFYNSTLSGGCEELRQILWAVAASIPTPEMEVSHRIVCLHSLGKIGDAPRWRIDFQSPYIAKRVVQRLGEEEDNRVREIITFISSLPNGKGSSLAGWLFEPLAHRAIMSTANKFDVNSSYWPVQKMTFQDHQFPAFVLIDLSQPCSGFLKVAREPVYFDSDALPTHLQSDEYYIPRASNLPFFDSFVVQLNASQGSAELWLLQMTISNHHRGSSMGLLLVRRMIQTLRQQLISHSGGPALPKQRIAPEVNANVHYVLVRPKGEEILQSK